MLCSVRNVSRGVSTDIGGRVLNTKPKTTWEITKINKSTFFCLLLLSLKCAAYFQNHYGPSPRSSIVMSNTTSPSVCRRGAISSHVSQDSPNNIRSKHTLSPQLLENRSLNWFRFAFTFPLILNTHVYSTSDWLSGLVRSNTSLCLRSRKIDRFSLDSSEELQGVAISRRSHWLTHTIPFGTGPSAIQPKLVDRTRVL